LTAAVAGLTLGDAGPAWAARASASATDTSLAPLSPSLGPWPARRGTLRARAARRPDGALQVRAVAELVARRAFRAQLAVAPCTAWRVDGGRPGAVALTHSGRDLIARRRLSPGASARLVISGRASSDAAGDPSPRRWTDCVTVQVLDERELGPALGPDHLLAVPALQNRPFLEVTLVLTTSGADGRPGRAPTGARGERRRAPRVPTGARPGAVA
jgi:hypothetical protein